MKSFLEIIVRMCVFMICAQALLQCRPSGAYEKHLKLLVSVILLMQLFFPVVTLFGEDEFKLGDQISEISQKVEEIRKSGLYQAEKSEELMERFTMGALEKQMDTKEALQDIPMGQEVLIDKVEVKIGE